MVKAVMSRGEILPLEPLPDDWHEGQSLRIEKADDDNVPLDQIDRDFAELEQLCASNDPSSEDQLDRALHEARLQSKQQVRRQMGIE